MKPTAEAAGEDLGVWSAGCGQDEPAMKPTAEAAGEVRALDRDLFGVLRLPQ